jgi:hypothetical protein
LITNLFNLFNRGEVMQLETLARGLKAELSIFLGISLLLRRL